MKLLRIKSPKGGTAIITGKGKVVYLPSEAYQKAKRKTELKPMYAEGTLERRYELKVIQSGLLLPIHRESVNVYY